MICVITITILLSILTANICKDYSHHFLVCFVWLCEMLYTFRRSNWYCELGDDFVALFLFYLSFTIRWTLLWFCNIEERTLFSLSWCWIYFHFFEYFNWINIWSYAIIWISLRVCWLYLNIVCMFCWSNILKCDFLFYNKELGFRVLQKIHQLDVKSTFLNGPFEEEVYVSQLPWFEMKGHKLKVYKLRKALYGSKQAPRVWNKRIDSFLI